MGKLGKSGNPIVFRVKNMERFEEIAFICDDNDWKFIGGIEPDKEEDISEVEYMLNPGAFNKPPKMNRGVGTKPYVKTEPKIGRNDPCPCGSGLKYKNCCMKK